MTDNVGVHCIYPNLRQWFKSPFLCLLSFGEAKESKAPPAGRTASSNQSTQARKVRITVKRYGVKITALPGNSKSTAQAAHTRRYVKIKEPA
jgi:hypothetical protein